MLDDVHRPVVLSLSRCLTVAICPLDRLTVEWSKHCELSSENLTDVRIENNFTMYHHYSKQQKWSLQLLSYGQMEI